MMPVWGQAAEASPRDSTPTVVVVGSAAVFACTVKQATGLLCSAAYSSLSLPQHWSWNGEITKAVSR